MRIKRGVRYLGRSMSHAHAYHGLESHLSVAKGPSPQAEVGKVILFDFKNKIHEFPMLGASGNYLKFVGSFEELDRAYDIMIQRNRILTLDNGSLLEYRFSNLLDSVFVKNRAITDTIMNSIAVEDGDEPSGTKIRSKDQGCNAVDSTLFMSRLDTGEIFVSAGDFRADLAKDSVSMIAFGLMKLISEKIPADTPIIIQCTTPYGVRGLRKTFGPPRNVLLFAEMLNFDSNLYFSEADLQVGQNGKIVATPLKKGDFAGYSEALQNVFMSDAFSAITPRQLRHLTNLEKVLAGQTLTENEMEDLKYYFDSFNAILEKTGRKAVTVSHILDRLQAGESPDGKTGSSIQSGETEEGSSSWPNKTETGKKKQEYRAVISDIVPSAWETFRPFYPGRFEQAPAHLCIGAMDEAKVSVGALIAQIGADRTSIEWLSVNEEHQREGIATFLVKSLLNYMSFLPGKKEVEAIVSVERSDLMGFFRRCVPFEMDADIPGIRLSWEDLKENFVLANLTGGMAENSQSMSFFDQPQAAREDFIYRMKVDWDYASVVREGLLEDLAEDLSICFVRDGLITEGVLFKAVGDHKLELLALCGEDSSRLIALMGDIYQIILRSYQNYAMVIPHPDRIREEVLTILAGESAGSRRRFVVRRR